MLILNFSLILRFITLALNIIFLVIIFRNGKGSLIKWSYFYFTNVIVASLMFMMWVDNIAVSKYDPKLGNFIKGIFGQWTFLSILYIYYFRYKITKSLHTDKLYFWLYNFLIAYTIIMFASHVIAYYVYSPFYLAGLYLYPVGTIFGFALSLSFVYDLKQTIFKDSSISLTTLKQKNRKLYYTSIAQCLSTITDLIFTNLSINAQYWRH